MNSDAILIELSTRLDSSLDADQNAALLEIAELLRLWSDSLRTGGPAALQDEDSRIFIRSKIMEVIDRAPASPVSATAIWVLGKLFDKSLEPYLANLAERFLLDGRLAWHLRQTVIALDNLELIPDFQRLTDQDDTTALRQVVNVYLHERTK